MSTSNPVTETFVPPDHLPPGSFAVRLKAADEARTRWGPQFQRAVRAAAVGGVRLPRAVYVHWHYLAANALWSWQEGLIRDGGDFRVMAAEIAHLNRPTASGANLGALLDQAPGRCDFYEYPHPILPETGWNYGIPHVLELDVVPTVENTGQKRQRPKRLTFVEFLERAAYLLSEPGPDAPGHEWLRRLAYHDGEGRFDEEGDYQGGGGPRIVARDTAQSAVQWERREPYYYPGDGTLWHLDDDDLPPWRVRVRECVEHACLDNALAHGTEVLPDLGHVPFSRLAAHVLTRVGPQADAVEDDVTKMRARKSSKPKQPSAERQKRIRTAIREAGDPLQRDAIRSALRMRTDGALGRDLAWMTAHGLLKKVDGEGYALPDNAPPV
jgi:hypothetical protein